MNIGDVVILKSGGPKMTVQKVREDKLVDCVWFFKAADGAWVGPHKAAFAPEELAPGP